MFLSEVGCVMGQYNFMALSEVGLLWVSTTGRNYFIAQSEVGFGMNQYDCRELTNGC